MTDAVTWPPRRVRQTCDSGQVHRLSTSRLRRDSWDDLVVVAKYFPQLPRLRRRELTDAQLHALVPGILGRHDRHRRCDLAPAGRRLVTPPAPATRVRGCRVLRHVFQRLYRTLPPSLRSTNSKGRCPPPSAVRALRQHPSALCSQARSASRNVLDKFGTTAEVKTTVSFHLSHVGFFPDHVSRYRPSSCPTPRPKFVTGASSGCVTERRHAAHRGP